jgi:hypothetical protein
MRNRIFTLIAVISFAILPGASVRGQQSGATIEELTLAIQKLEAIDANPATPADIRQLNREFLGERRAKLLSLLVEKKRALRDYLTTTSSALSQDQIARVEQQLTDLDKKIGNLQSFTSGAATTISKPTPAATNSTNSDNGQTSSGDGASPPRTLTTSPGLSSSSSSPANVTVPSPGSGGSAPPTQTSGQGAPATQGGQFKALLAGAVNRIQTDKGTNPTATIDLRNTFMLLALSLTEETRKDVVANFTSKADEVKTDKQTGSNQGGGSSSLVTKASIPAVLGFAVENGALTRTENSTGITFSGTPVGIIEALSKKGFIESYQNDDSFDRFLRNFSFKFTFDPNRGSTPGTFTGSGQQLSGYSVRYKLVDQRDPRDPKYTSQWSRLVETRAVPVTATLAAFFTKLYTAPTPGFTAWRTETEAAIAAATPADVEVVLIRQLESLRKVDLGIEVNSLISTFSSQFDSFLKARDDILDQINAGWSSTIEYNNERRAGGLPSLSNIRFIAEKGAYGGSLDFTANASLTFLNTQLPGTNNNRLRDFRFAGQLDVPLGNVATTGKFFLSFAGLYERLTDDELLSNGIVAARKGDIATGQVKLTIPIRGTAFKIPLSFSFANRTELIKEKHVKGSFGFTFDLDSILARFNPFTQK